MRTFRIRWLTVGVLAALALTLGTLEPAEAKAPKAKKYYLTEDFSFKGNQALTACEAKFHMASLWEIRDTTDLDYDSTLGKTGEDSGFGPPACNSGWIRTGVGAAGDDLQGLGNCFAWTSDFNTHRGTAARLQCVWSVPPLTISPWSAVTFPCDFPLPVWCVED